MTKRKNSEPLSSLELGELIKAALPVDDFGHEMQIRSVLEYRGIKVKHGWSYVDPVLGKTRQFDFRFGIKNRSYPRYLQFAVECKNLTPDSPLIVSGSPREKVEAFHDIAVSESENSMVAFPQAILRQSEGNVLYPYESFVGKSLLRLKLSDDGMRLQPSREKESEIYDRWSQALASAHQLCDEALNFAQRVGSSAKTVVIPGVVVPDYTLWTVEYAREGGIRHGPQKCDSTTLFLNHQVGLGAEMWMSLSHVHFWTTTGFRDFLGGLLADPNDAWGRWFPESAEQIVPDPSAS